MGIDSGDKDKPKKKWNIYRPRTREVVHKTELKDDFTIREVDTKKKQMRMSPINAIGKKFYINDQVDMPRYMKDKFNSEIVKMVTILGRKSFN